MHSVDHLVMCFGYFNGHVVRHIDRADDFHAWCCVGIRKVQCCYCFVLIK